MADLVGDIPDESKANNPNTGEPDHRDDGDRLIMYFHGNAEDLFHNVGFLQQLKENFGASILAMEYPGYGFFSHEIKGNEVDFEAKLNCCNQKIKACAITCF